MVQGSVSNRAICRQGEWRVLVPSFLAHRPRPRGAHSLLLWLSGSVHAGACWYGRVRGAARRPWRHRALSNCRLPSAPPTWVAIFNVNLLKITAGSRWDQMLR
jgi:hypothetical protein